MKVGLSPETFKNKISESHSIIIPYLAIKNKLKNEKILNNDKHNLKTDQYDLRSSKR